MESSSSPPLRPNRCFLFVALAAILSCSSFTTSKRAGAESSSSKDQGGVIILNGNTIRCPLREGETTFIVSSRDDSMLDRLIVVNENAAAHGELKIAVSNDKLPAASEKWRAVEGSIQFSHKRLLNVSLVGVEAKYAKLVFHVRDGKSRTSRVVALPALTSIIRLF
jgi:hypothetical protein